MAFISMQTLSQTISNSLQTLRKRFSDALQTLCKLSLFKSFTNSFQTLQTPFKPFSNSFQMFSNALQTRFKNPFQMLCKLFTNPLQTLFEDVWNAVWLKLICSVRPAFLWKHIINRILLSRSEIQNFSSRGKLVKYFSTLKEKFRISTRPCNILYWLDKITATFSESPTKSTSRINNHSKWSAVYFT